MPKKWSENEVASIVRLSSLINSSLDIMDVLNNSMQVVEELMDAEASSIFEIDQEKNDLFFRITRGEAGSGAEKVRLKIGEGIAGWVAASGRPLVVPDTEKDERFSIRYKDRITGVIEVINMRGAGPFEGNLMEVMSVVSEQIGVAIENAKLHERLRDKFTLTQAELKETQARLIQSERMAALGQLSRGVAHVVRNPVMSIGGFTRRLGRKLPPDSGLSDYVNLILEETSRLEKLVQDVSKFTSLSAPSFKKVHLSDFLSSVVEEWKTQQGVTAVKVEMSLLPENPVIHLDTSLMAMAVKNLMDNAREAVVQEGSVCVTLLREDTRVVISVRDNGRGINPGDLPLVFDPFFTTRTYGSGLGLTTVNRIAEDHHGEVRIMSLPGEGTEVKIYISTASGVRQFLQN